MTESPATAERSANLQEVARLMRDYDCGAIPIVDDGAPVGVVTDRDITVRAVADGRDSRYLTAGDVMTSAVVSVEPDEDASRVLEMMRERQIRRVVVSQNGSIVGIISQADIARAMPEETTGELVEDISQSA